MEKLPNPRFLVSEQCAFHLDLKGLQDGMRQSGATLMEMIFYPGDSSKDAVDGTNGHGALQFGSETPLVWTCTFAEFKQAAEAFGFVQYEGNPVAFCNKLTAAAYAQMHKMEVS